MALERNLFLLAGAWFPSDPISHTILGTLGTLIVIFLINWRSLGNESYSLNPLGEKGAFEPHLKRYQDLAKLIVTLATASIAFLFSFLVNRPIDIKSSNVYAVAVEHASPLAICALASSVFLLLLYILGLTYSYEEYCHLPPGKRDNFKGWLYAIYLSVGWTGFLTFLFAYGYLAFKLIRRN